MTPKSSVAGAALDAAGLDRVLRPHQLRHTLTTRVLQATSDLRLVQSALGHRSIASTVRYTAVSDRARTKGLEGI